MTGRPSSLSSASGDEVQFVGSAMAGVVQAVDAVADVIGERPVVVGGLAVMCRLGSPHRATTDLDIVDRRGPGRESTLEVLRSSQGAKDAPPAGAMIETPSGLIKVDVLEVRQVEIDYPSDDAGDRLHASSHAWALETATTVGISVVGERSAIVAATVAHVAQPGPIVAMKLQAIEDRTREKAGTDLLDIVRITLDRKSGPTALDQLAGCNAAMAADMSQYVDRWLSERRVWSLGLIQGVGGDVSGENLELAHELLLDACRRD